MPGTLSPRGESRDASPMNNNRLLLILTGTSKDIDADMHMERDNCSVGQCPSSPKPSEALTRIARNHAVRGDGAFRSAGALHLINTTSSG